jgi:hypothetical protein
LDKDRRVAESEWIRATGEYKRSLEKLLALYRGQFQEKAERVVQLREFYERKLIARSDLEESQRALSEMEAKLGEIESKIAEADLAMGAANAWNGLEPVPVEAIPRSGTLIHYDGRARWSLAGMERIEQFFLVKFGRPLPVSASGQTAVHDGLQLDHRNAVDVAVHPGSPEGRALMTYLRGEGIPFIAFSAPVAGSATGAHIHIGLPSVRLSAAASRRR